MGTVSLKHRQVVPELMDAPDLDPKAHAQALAGLRRLNAAANAASAIGPAVALLASRRKLRRLQLLDIACGGGDVTMGVVRWLKPITDEIRLTLSDMSPVALKTAQALAASHGIAAQTALGSAPDNLPQGQWDIVMCTLFLHHLNREQVVGTLREMARRARHMVVVADLRRSWWGYLLAQVMCRLLSRSPIVHFDGPVSVRAAWTIAEMKEMAREAGLNAVVQPCWPARMRLIAEKPA